MNYNDMTQFLFVVAASREKSSEPDCSPHPLDILAIFALYQTR